jgi:hypothetical protein
MSPMQWAFEFYALKKKEDDALQTTFTCLRQLLVGILGLNMLKPEDENKIPKKYEDMTPEERDAFLPLVAWCARPEMLKPVADQIQAESAIQQAENDKNYEKLVEAIDAADGDMSPIFGPVNPIVGKPRKYPDIDNGSASDVEFDVEDI